MNTVAGGFISDLRGGAYRLGRGGGEEGNLLTASSTAWSIQHMEVMFTILASIKLKCTREIIIL